MKYELLEHIWECVVQYKKEKGVMPEVIYLTPEFYVILGDDVQELFAIPIEVIASRDSVNNK